MVSEETGRPRSSSESPQDGNNDKGPEAPETSSEEPHKSWITSIWGKVGLDIPTILIMMKGAVAPTIALGIYQAQPVAEEYATIGYLVGIITILGFPVLPRAKFLQTILLNVIATCFSTAIAILALWSSVQARIHTQPQVRPGTGGPGTVGTPSPGAQTGGYNPSQSTVCAIWLFFQIYMANALKSRYPQLQFPSLIWSIFAVVSMSYGPNFTTTAQALSFAERLLEAFLSGFGIAFGVDLLIFPMTSRKIVFKVIPAYIGAIRGALKAHTKYVESLEHSDMFSPDFYSTRSDRRAQAKEKPHKTQAMAFKEAAGALNALNAKLHGEIPFAKREFAYGKLDTEDLKELMRLLQGISIPLMGLSSVADIFERTSHRLGWDHDATSGDKQSTKEADSMKERAVHDWNHLAKLMHEPIASLTQTMDEALQHTLLKLQFINPPKKSKSGMDLAERDVEAKGDVVQPGDPAFSQYVDAKIQEFEATKQPLLRKWCKLEGVDLPADFFERPSDPESFLSTCESDSDQQRRRRQTYVVLYIELLLASTGRAVLELVYFADLKARSGRMDRNHLVVPGYRRIKKWLGSIFTCSENTSDDLHDAMNDGGSTGSTVYLGAAFQKRKDPDHLPPENILQKVGDYIRVIPKALGSSHSDFGLRVACATLTIAIVGYLRDTHIFYVKQRLMWAVIMISISMTPTAGQSLLNFSLRIVGTTIAMILSLVAWYIVDGHPAGVLVFFWIFCSMGFYVPLKLPRYTTVGVISIITMTTIIGYELQVQKIGVKISTSNGQPYYPIYELAPYRLATVAAGVFVAFVWTIFPYPITEHSQLRRHLGSSLYLLANLYSVVHETIRHRIQAEEGDMNSKDSPGRKLEKARVTIFAKQSVLLGQMQQITGFLKWEIPVGGRFPKEVYTEILKHVENVQNYTALLGYASKTFHDIRTQDETKWIQDFRELLRASSLTSNEMTSLLSLLSLSIRTGQPLPPYMNAPIPFAYTKLLGTVDQDILSIRHLAEPGYAAFATMQIMSHCIASDIGRLLELVREAIGEMDFSFHPISITDGSHGENSQDSLLQGQGDERKQD